ncbi:tetratricopeptide repeat protein [Dactylosporangium sp. NBC_01737]|uniref:tetratricopeptide repeat protein n=1 Tax=Dactylosporangium sp. NBC_01737 TaxID=2975959 RepID=UPI002E144A28|nr:tetratricopeptide repeat protein [Dactylosporangium sp. NBC_01737]
MTHADLGSSAQSALPDAAGPQFATLSPDAPGNAVQFNTAADRGVVYAVQNGNQYVYRYEGTPPYRVRLFAGRQPLRDELVAAVPSWLLSARHQVVPFFGREEELDRLREWRDTAACALSVLLLTGDGGQGKTRLALQFAAECTAAGWATADVRHHSEPAAAGGDEQIAVAGGRMLLVVDYAERWPLHDLITLLVQHQAAATRPVRVLLLSRPADWRHQLRHQLAKVDINDVTHLALSSLTRGDADRVTMYTSARDHFARVLRIDHAGDPAPPDIGGAGSDSVLGLHMAALAAVDAAARGVAMPANRAGLSAYLLNREQEHWQSLFETRAGGHQTPAHLMARVVYIAALEGPVSHDDAMTVAGTAERGLTAVEVSAALRDHRSCYPPAHAGVELEPLRPDRLAEDFVALMSPGHDADYAADPWAGNAVERLVALRTGERLDDGGGKLLTLLVEAAGRWQHLAVGYLYPLLRTRPDLALATSSATLSTLAALPDADIDALAAVESTFPAESRLDLDVGFAAISTRVTAHRLTTTDDPQQQAGLYFNLSLRLAGAGDLDAALTAAQRSADLYRSLPRDDADLAAHVTLARALSNHAGCLQAVGRNEDALATMTEVMAIHARFIGELPSILPDVAHAVSRLAIVLHLAGRRTEGIEAADQAAAAYRELARHHPGSFDHELATVLYNLGIHRSELGQHVEALQTTEEATALYERLAGTDPAQFMVLYAESLSNLAIHRAGVGRYADAIDAAARAVDMVRRAAAVNPTVEARLAVVLENLALRQHEFGAPQDAVETGAEAIGMYRRFAVRWPAAYDPLLARALLNACGPLIAVRELERALAAAHESAQVYSRLAGATPMAFEFDRCRAQLNVGAVLAKLERWDDAAASIESAVPVLRRGAVEQPDAFAPDLAAALSNLAAAYTKLERWQDALASVEEAIRILRQPERQRAEVLRPRLDAAEQALAILHREHPTHRAERLLRQLANAGSARCAGALGELEYRRGRLDVGERWLTVAATTGDRRAITMLVHLLMTHGRAFEAEEWLRRVPAADAAEIRAVLGGGPESEERLRRAAGSGDVESMWQLSLLLQWRGRPTAANGWLRMAAAAGHVDAMAHLGKVLSSGPRVREAEAWLRRAIALGHTEAMRTLGLLLGRQRRYAESRQLLDRMQGARPRRKRPRR